MKSKIIISDVLNLEKQKSMHSATIEEALNLTGFGKYNFALLLVCSWTLQAMGMDLFGGSFTAAAAVCDLQLDMQKRALLTAMPLVGVVLGAQLWGYMADTRGRRLTVVLSMAIGFVFGSASSLSPDWKTMAVLKLLSSTFTSATNSGAYTLLGECCHARARGRAMLLCTSALMCSQAVSAVFAYPILPLTFSYPIPFLNITFRPWRLLTLVLALPCGVSALLLLFFHESPKFLASQGRREEALHVLASIFAVNTGNKADLFPVKKLIVEPSDLDQSASSTRDPFLKAIWRQTAPLFTPPMLKGTLHLFYLVIIIYMTGSGFILWLPYIMNNVFSVLQSGGGGGMNLCTVISLPDSLASNVNSTLTTLECDDTIQDTTLLTAMSYGAVASSANLVLSLTAGSNKRRAMMCILGCSASSALLLNLVPSPIAGVVFFFMFLMCALSMGLLSVYFVELYPTNLRGMASCLSVMVGRTSAFVGVNLIGAIINTDCEMTFYVWAVFLFTELMCALSMGLLSVYFVELYPTNLRGMASCLSVMVGRTSAFVGVNLIGAIINTDCEMTFYVWAVFLFSGIAFSYFLPKDNEEKE